MTWTMPWFSPPSLPGAQSWMPNSRQFRSSAVVISSAVTSMNGRVCDAGRHDVIDGRERALGKRHPPAVLPQHVERLRAGHFVNEVQADEQLRLPARQRADGVRIPDFLKKSSCHCHSRLRGIVSPLDCISMNRFAFESPL